MSLAPLAAPNEAFLEAQARVCTGPHQTRPLGRKDTDPDPLHILTLMIDSLEHTTTTPVSLAQMGAFLTAMTIRRSFPTHTNWSTAEQAAFTQLGPRLTRLLPDPCRLLMDPTHAFDTLSAPEACVVEALRPILQGQHLSYTTTRQVLTAILHHDIHPALAAAVLIGQRMNLESYEEVHGYLDAVLAPDDVVKIKTASLTHFGQPYDGATRYFRPTVFVAAVRAALGRPSVLHGVDQMPPKNGVTDEQILHALGAATHLSRPQAAQLLSTPDVGFAYVSQREYAPAAYRLQSLRQHIKKRPPWAATEKAQRLFSSSGTNYMVIGYYHAGYEEPLLRLMQEQTLDAGMVLKGEEGGCNYSLRSSKPSSPTRKAINYTQGFCRRTNNTQSFAADINPATLGFAYEHSPRPDEISASAFAHLGQQALQGKPGPSYDRIVLNAALTDYYLGFAKNIEQALDAARGVIAQGTALKQLESYIDTSQSLA